ncbi:MAG: TolB family protein [Gemmatimonadales bacterium]
MTDGATLRTIEFAERDACQRRASLPCLVPLTPLVLVVLVVLAALLGVASAAGAQLAPRPWLDWRTAETEHFILHYPERYREWTLALAERIEGIRDQVDAIVGYSPTHRVNVVVDDPANVANGYAFTPLDAPTIVLWPSPPDPRSEIGNARVWEELLATHEFTHVAHLVRPSRNEWRRLLWSLSPVPLGPIALKSPRWVIEGYATYVEGKVTGSGRPNNAWRAAIIRQFALEGRLPSYGQLSATGGWETGSFAYLVGSAYLEWLARRQGDSSIVALWRRMTAVTDRSFDEAFSGVYGGSPAELYGRFTAEVTADALAIDRALLPDTLSQGTLVQRLIRDTGDPAVSPDGRYVALTVRRVDAPSQLVVWKTAADPDNLIERRRAREHARDPEDVPNRRFYPAPRKPVITLVANDGAPYESPRWLADDKHLRVTRLVPLADGTLRQDLFVWSAEDGDLRRVTRGAGVEDADPSSDGHWAAATRCDHGWCDLVRIDLATGVARVLRAGSVTRNYYRPRVSRTTGEIVVSEQTNDRWRIARVSPESGELRYADPDDGVTRYDATFALDGRAIIATSESGGIPNLERLDPAGLRTTRLTSVTGAAVAPDVAPDGAIWFLALRSEGYDLRRLSDSTSPAPVRPLPPLLVDSLSPVLPPRIVRLATDSSARPVRANAPAERGYGLGPSRFRYVPGSTTGFGGTTSQLALVRSDPVGRLGISLLGSAGAGSLPEGGALTLSTRASRTGFIASAWASHEAPSRNYGAALDRGLDLARVGTALRVERTHVGDGWDLTGALAGLGELQRSTDFASSTRHAGLLAIATSARQRDDRTRYQEWIAVNGEAGRTAGASYLRQRSAFTFGTASGTHPLTNVSIAYGSIGGRGSERESFVLGGIASPLIDSLYDARRVDAPAYPLASSSGSSFATYRVGLPVSVVELFYAGATTDLFQHELRSFGAELRQQVPAIAALGTPEVDVVSGIARAVDEPVKGRWRYYMTLVLRP